MTTLLSQSNAPLSVGGPMRSYPTPATYGAQQVPTQPNLLNTTYPSTPMAGASVPAKVNSEPLSLDAEGYSSITTAIDVEKSAASQFLNDSQLCFLVASKGKLSHKEWVDGLLSETSNSQDRLNKATIVGLPHANHLMCAMVDTRTNRGPGQMIAPAIKIIRERISEELRAAGCAVLSDNHPITEAEIYGIVFADAGTPRNGYLTPAQRRILSYTTARSVEKQVRLLGPIATQPNRIRSSDDLGAGNVSAAAGETMAVVVWRGRGEVRDVFGLSYSTESPINHTRLLFLLLKRVCYAPKNADGTWSTEQAQWSGFQYVPFAVAYGQQTVPEEHTQYLGYGGATEYCIPVYVGQVMMQVDKQKVHTEAQRMLAAGVSTAATLNHGVLQAVAAARTMNLYVINTCPQHNTYGVHVHG